MRDDALFQLRNRVRELSLTLDDVAVASEQKIQRDTGDHLSKCQQLSSQNARTDEEIAAMRHYAGKLKDDIASTSRIVTHARTDLASYMKQLKKKQDDLAEVKERRHNLDAKLAQRDATPVAASNTEELRKQVAVHEASVMKTKLQYNEYREILRMATNQITTGEEDLRDLNHQAEALSASIESFNKNIEQSHGKASDATTARDRIRQLQMEIQEKETELSVARMEGVSASQHLCDGVKQRLLKIRKLRTDTILAHTERGSREQAELLQLLNDAIQHKEAMLDMTMMVDKEREALREHHDVLRQRSDATDKQMKSHTIELEALRAQLRGVYAAASGATKSSVPRVE